MVEGGVGIEEGTGGDGERGGVGCSNKRVTVEAMDRGDEGRDDKGEGDPSK